jgi:amino acid transporter
VLAESIGVISPTMTAVLIIPFAFSFAAQGTWFVYLFGTVMLMFVVINLNQFARRKAGAGSMYAYTAQGLGPTAGVFSGWTLIWCYLFIGIAGLTGFAIFAQQFLGAVGAGFTAPPVLLYLISASLCWFVAYRDIHVSSALTLLLEALSMACIAALAGIVLFKHGFSVDTAQLKLKGLDFHGLSYGIVASVFSLVGFESATALGGEAKNPLRNVPKAVIWSLVIAGIWFVVMSYVEVGGTHNYGTSWQNAPLIALAKIYGVSAFRIPICLGAMVSFFGLTLTCLNAGARIIYRMAGHDVLPTALGRAHHHNRTPHVSITVYIALIVTVPILLEIFTNPNTMFDDAGTLAAFGFLTAYFLISIAAPAFLKKRGELKLGHVAIAVAAFLCLLVPTIGTFYPVPPWPMKIFPFIFLAYMVLGGIWFFVANKQRPGVLSDIAIELASDPSTRLSPPAMDMEPLDRPTDLSIDLTVSNGAVSNGPASNGASKLEEGLAAEPA